MTKRMIITTRLPSNLRSTTCEWVHLVTHGHFQSRDKDGGQTIWSAVAENPMLSANFTALSVIETELLAINIVHNGNKDLRSFLFLWHWPNDHIRTWPVFPQNAKMNFLRQGFQKLSSNRHRDRTQFIYHAAWQVVSNMHISLRSYCWLMLYIMGIRIFNRFCSCDTDPMTTYKLDLCSLKTRFQDCHKDRLQRQ